MGAKSDAESRPDLIVVGRITAVYGVRGWVRLASFTDPMDNLLAYRPWMIEERGRWRELPVGEVRLHGKGYVARIEGCDDRDEAARYAGRDLWVPAERLPPAEEDEYYWFELEGLKVRTTAGVELGRVDHLFATGANDVMVVKGEQGETDPQGERAEPRERLLPFIADVVVEVDREQGVIRVEWDPEL